MKSTVYIKYVEMDREGGRLRECSAQKVRKKISRQNLKSLACPLPNYGQQEESWAEFSTVEMVASTDMHLLLFL
jgi:hypothetical protein